MKHYKIMQDGFKEIKKQMLIRILPIFLIVVTVGITISVINTRNKPGEVNDLPIIIPIIAIIVGFGLYRGVNRHLGLLESYQLILANNLITREQLNTPTLTIYFTDITEIVKNKNGSFIIKGKESTDLIVVPAQIENYVEIENILARITPVATKPRKSFLEQYSMPISIFAVALMVCVYTVTNKIIVAFSGTMLAAIMSWSFYEVRKNKNIDSRTRRSMWWVLLVMASIIGVMIMKIMGVQKT